LGFIFATDKWEIVGLFIIFGVFYSIDEAQTKAFIADLEPERRGSAIGLYNFFSGIVYLPASLIAGALWTVDPSYSFVFALIVSVIALLIFAVMDRRILR
ncbi:MAG: MFS transporter, partial [Patescibacteria group bacterium]|nr:MFS transporter [Patescibacteria group bacterium]